MIPVAAADVPQNLADTLAAAFVDGFVALPYTPFLGGCRAYQTRAMEACYEDEADGRHWAVDVAVNCTDGAWAAVSTILVHGVAVESQEGNLTVVSSELVGLCGCSGAAASVCRSDCLLEVEGGQRAGGHACNQLLLLGLKACPSSPVVMPLCPRPCRTSMRCGV